MLCRTIAGNRCDVLTITEPMGGREAMSEAMLEQIGRMSPEDVQGFKNLMQASERCFQLGFQELGMIPFETLGDVVKAMPNLARMQAWRSIYSLVAQHIKHPKLRIVMSFHPLLIGGNPYSVTCVYALIHALERRWGVHSAMGGTGAIVRELVNLLEARNVPIRYNTPVTRIRVEAGRARGVELANGEFIPADIVVSNGDAAWTYRHLVEPQHRKHWTDKRIAKGNYSSGLFVWYFGTDRQYHDVPHHMMVLGPRYKGLLQDIFKNHTLSKDFAIRGAQPQQRYRLGRCYRAIPRCDSHCFARERTAQSQATCGVV